MKYLVELQTKIDVEKKKIKEIVLLFQAFPPLLQKKKKWNMEKSKITYKTKDFPCALCILAVSEVHAALQMPHKHKDTIKMENLKKFI